MPLGCKPRGCRGTCPQGKGSPSSQPAGPVGPIAHLLSGQLFRSLHLSEVLYPEGCCLAACPWPPAWLWHWINLGHRLVQLVGGRAGRGWRQPWTQNSLGHSSAKCLMDISPQAAWLGWVQRRRWSQLSPWSFQPHQHFPSPVGKPRARARHPLRISRLCILQVGERPLALLGGAQDLYLGAGGGFAVRSQ